VRSPSDGRDIAGEDRSSEGEQASSGSRGQFVVAAKKYKVPQCHNRTLAGAPSSAVRKPAW